MRFSRLLVAFAAPLVVACGIGASQNGQGPGTGDDAGGDDDGGLDARADARSDARADASCGQPPHITCTGCDGNVVPPVCLDGTWSCEVTPCPPPPVCSGPEPYCTDCNGKPVSPQCQDGAWQCPVFGCPIEVDAGCGPQPPDLCFLPPPPCAGGIWVPECNGNSWTCASECPIDDGGPPPIDASPPPSFACVDVGCDPLTSYCQLTTGGPVVVDGGGFGAQCIPLPKTCASGPATCACVQALQGIGCSCVEQHGDVTVTCELP